MEAQDLRISRLEDIMDTAVRNQTQILRIQQEHSDRLDEQSEPLANLEKSSTRMLEELVAIKEILASPRGHGLRPRIRRQRMKEPRALLHPRLSF